MGKKRKRKVYHGYAMFDLSSDSYQFCDIEIGPEEMIVNLHTPIVL